VVDSPDQRPRFLSEADCHDILRRLRQFAVGGGHTDIHVLSLWRGSIRWARNQVSAGGEISNNTVRVLRNVRGAIGVVEINDTTDAALVAATRRAERLMAFRRERPNSEFVPRLPLEPSPSPQLFSDATYHLNAERRAAAALALTQQAHATGMLSSGYIEVAAVSMAMLDTFGRVRYFPYTQARYSVTVRDPKGTGSGWAGVDWHDWAKIDAPALTTRALEKCIRSRNPVRVEPGRYTTILEPQAVSDFVGQLFRTPGVMGRDTNEYRNSPRGPFLKSEPTQTEPGYSRLGERIVDERITISADPSDPQLGFPPFGVGTSIEGDPFIVPVYHPVTWIERGVLTNLSYPRLTDIGSDRALGRDQNLGLPNSGAFRMSGGDTSIEEMIATTKRGLLVTRFDKIILINFTSQLYRGYTRDGLWLVEDGKISKPARNLVFTESPLFALNKIEQLGVPQRVFNPTVAFLARTPQPAVVPPLKISDLSFTALSDAI
jgi:predicted Zn-dependent protease